MGVQSHPRLLHGWPFDCGQDERGRHGRSKERKFGGDLGLQEKSVGLLVGRSAGEEKVDAPIKQTIRDASRDFKTFREKVGYPNQTPAPNKSWRAGWPKSADMVLKLIEDMNRHQPLPNQ